MNIALFCSLIIFFVISQIKVLWFWLIHDCTWKIFIMNDSQPFWSDDYSSHSWNRKKTRKMKSQYLMIQSFNKKSHAHYDIMAIWFYWWDILWDNVIEIFVVFEHAYQKIAKKNQLTTLTQLWFQYTGKWTLWWSISC